MHRKTKIRLTFASVLVLAGCILFVGGMAMANWDFTKLNTHPCETNTHTVQDNFTSISIQSKLADVHFVPSEECKVVCYEMQKVKHSVSVEEKTLIIKAIDERKWQDHIGITLSVPKITVYLPSKAYEALMIQGDTGDINVGSTSCDTINLSVSTGKISLSEAVCAGDVTIQVSTGDVALANVTCKNLFSTGNTGDFSLKNVVAHKNLSIERSTGDIKLEACDAAELHIKTNTGDIKGNLLSEKIFIIKTNTGKVDVPTTTSGGICEITSNTGDIVLGIE